MFVKIAYYKDMWREIKQNALFTEHKFEEGKYPSSKWKKQMLLCEHSPIRTGMIIVEVHDVPVFVIDHFVRHHVGFTPFVSSLRDDRNEFPEGYIPNRETLNSMRFEGNFQAFINISRKRLCNKAHPETKKVWQAILNAVKEVEPELVSCCVRECVYRGFCPERKSCGYYESSGYIMSVVEYRMPELAGNLTTPLVQDYDSLLNDQKPNEISSDKVVAEYDIKLDYKKNDIGGIAELKNKYMEKKNESN